MDQNIQMMCQQYDHKHADGDDQLKGGVDAVQPRFPVRP